MPAHEGAAHALAERLCAVLNDAADAHVDVIFVSGTSYHLVQEGQFPAHVVHWDPERDYWDVREP